MKTHYYQLVRSYGKYDIEYVIHEARKDAKNNIEIAAIPLVLVGNHPDEIRDTITHLLEDMKKHPAVDKDDCDIFDDNLEYEERDDG